MDIKDITALLEPGMRIFVAGSSNEPAGLLAALEQEELPPGLHFVQFPIGGLNGVDFTAWHDTFEQTTFFMTPSLRHAPADRLHFLPMHMRTVFDYLQQGIDVALIQVAYDRDGVLRLGPNVDFVDAAIESASVVIAQLNRSIVAPAGSPIISTDRLAAVFECERAIPQLPDIEVDATSAKIGELVASIIQDGDCLQTGIGAIPAAILSQLHNKNDLGMHGGLIDEGGMRLIQNGNMNGRCKPIDTGLHITGMGLGSSALYEWLAEMPEVHLRGANYTHEVSVIGQLPNFVSVNSAVEIDLFGQVNAEYAGGRQISGTGGSVDFMRGAKASTGGRSIVAMNATARGGSVSRIVPQVSMVTALRTDVDYVVTEFGIARLRNLPAVARAEALINIAAPEFRGALREKSAS